MLLMSTIILLSRTTRLVCLFHGKEMAFGVSFFKLILMPEKCIYPRVPLLKIWIEFKLNWTWSIVVFTTSLPLPVYSLYQMRKRSTCYIRYTNRIRQEWFRYKMMRIGSRLFSQKTSLLGPIPMVCITCTTFMHLVKNYKLVMTNS